IWRTRLVAQQGCHSRRAGVGSGAKTIMDYLQAARAVLEQASRPLSSAEITRRAWARGFIAAEPNKTTTAAMHAALSRAAAVPYLTGVRQVAEGLWSLAQPETNSASTAQQKGSTCVTTFDLLHQLPWLRAYGTRIVNSLWRAGVRRATDILSLSPEEFRKLRGVGEGQVELLLQIQARLKAHAVPAPESQPHAHDDQHSREISPTRGPARLEEHPAALSGTEVITEDVTVLELADLGLTPGGLLLNSLLRAGARTVGEVLSLKPEDFAAVRGVGVKKLEALLLLQEEIRARLAKPGPPQPTQAPTAQELAQPSQAAAGPEESCLEAAGQEVAPRLAVRAAPQYPSLTEAFRDLARHAAARGCTSPMAERNADIWLRRAGAGAGPIPTLEEVATPYGLTRQRVRQIYARQTVRMRRLACRDPYWMGIGEAVIEVLTASLGCVCADYMARQLALRMGWQEEPAPRHLAVLGVLLSGTAYAFDVDEDTTCIWHPSACDGLWEAAERCAQRLLAQLNAEEHIEDFAHRLSHALNQELAMQRNADAPARPENPAAHASAEKPVAGEGSCWGDNSAAGREVKCCGAREGTVCLPAQYVRARLMAIQPTPLIGDMVRPAAQTWLSATGNLRRAVYAALAMAGRPLHYTEIARIVREQNPRLHHVSDHTVHGCLVRCEEFVLTQRLGTYGLRRWGVEPYRTVADRVEELLERAGRPLDKREIAEALAKEGVPYNNVQAAFKQRRFRVYPDGCVGLSKWGSTAEAAQPTSADGDAGLSFLFPEDDWLIVI
ncbi:MAG: hypothetical protein N2512_12365, partial [Armatimonadetes bacterium]|nr:hypothetical protein [Armatimonadota bacterium]